MTFNHGGAGLEGRHLRVERGEALVFDDLSFTAGPGSLTHLRGDNGSGKTTLLRTLAGLVTPEFGEVWWHGARVGGTRSFAHELNFIGHHHALNAELTPLKDVPSGASIVT